jgi:hypothetical protein
VLVGVLLAVATLLGFFACFAVWVNRQALNTDNWTNTSSRLLANTHVQEALSTYLVNELFTAEDVPAQLETALPTQVKGLAGPLSAGLRAVADRAVPKLLASPQAQELWRRANKTAHKELLLIIKGNNKVLATSGGVVALNLHELVTQLGAQLGVSSQVESARSKLSGSTGATVRSTAKEHGITLPENTGRIVIMRSKQLKTAQNIVKAIKGLALVLPLLALALFALSIWLAQGWRRRALRSTGACFFGIGVALLVLRKVGGDQVVSSLVKNPDNKEAGEAVWSIATSLLYDIATAMVLYGLVLVAAAWLAGPTRPATFLRRASAPFLRVHVAGSYAVAGVLLLLIVLWGPTPGTRQLLPVLGFAALAAFGVTLLRHQTALEFPHAQPGEALAEMRTWWPFGRGHSEHGANAAGSPPATAANGPPPSKAATTTGVETAGGSEPPAPGGSPPES